MRAIVERLTEERNTECQNLKLPLLLSPESVSVLSSVLWNNIYAQTTLPFRLIYVCGGAPPSVRRYLEREAEQRGFQFLHTEHYLSPNQARNLSLSEVRTKYVVFLDNDALVTRGWLESLLNCAEETGAWVVGPLDLIGEFDRAMIHMAGGRLHIKEEEGKRVLWDEQYLFDTPISEANMRLRRRPCEYVEFHCMLVRTQAFERVGLMDEQLLSLHEERDFCLANLRAGGAVYIEPKAVVTYVPPPPCEWWDLPYFMLRWSEGWTLTSVRHFNKKWGIAGVRHASDTSNDYEEGTVIGFARAWRRRIAGLKVRSDDMHESPSLPLGQAEIMIALLQSIDRERFALALTTGDGQVVASAPSLYPYEAFQRLPHFLHEAEMQELNITIHPLDHGGHDVPALVRFDDLSAEDMARVKRYAFMTLETKPNYYQCWIAVDRKNPRSAATLARLALASTPHTNMQHAMHLVGSKLVRPQFRLANGQYPRVRLVEGVAGLIATAGQLEASEVKSFLTSSATL